ncbi:MAG: hypothetical protein WBD80_11725, partial [Xanthobacteraceae bacterium]
MRSIGIEVRAATLIEPTFLPGLDIRHGAILADEARLTYPGDILHEAGHIAVAVRRNAMRRRCRRAPATSSPRLPGPMPRCVISTSTRPSSFT